MAYKQNNNPFKKLHGDLQGFGERHAAWKAKREEMPQKKYGHFSEGAKAYRADKKAGESRFQYDIRMRKEGRKAADKPVTPIALKSVGANKLPNIGAKKGRKASGCPVSGFVVIGIADANPLTSAGFT